MLNYKMQKHREHRNLFGAHCAGLLEPFLARWNNDYFGPLGLHIRIDPPGVGRMENMDVASTQHFRLLQKMGKSSTAPGTASGREKRKERRYQLREGHQRVKAARKCRIVVMPFSGVSVPDTTQVEPIQIGTLDREDSSDDGDSGIRVDAPTPSHVRVNTTHWGGGLDGDVSDRATTEEQGAEELDLDVLHASEDDAQPVAES